MLIQSGMSVGCLSHLQSVEDDFVDMRKDNPESVSAEDLHRLLVVARCASVLSFSPMSSELLTVQGLKWWCVPVLAGCCL